jgi:hypothetical protein
MNALTTAMSYIILSYTGMEKVYRGTKILPDSLADSRMLMSLASRRESVQVRSRFSFRRCQKSIATHGERRKHGFEVFSRRAWWLDLPRGSQHQRHSLRAKSRSTFARQSRSTINPKRTEREQQGFRCSHINNNITPQSNVLKLGSAVLAEMQKKKRRRVRLLSTARQPFSLFSTCTI